jgi:hypothetical protein
MAASAWRTPQLLTLRSGHRPPALLTFSPRGPQGPSSPSHLARLEDWKCTSPLGKVREGDHFCNNKPCPCEQLCDPAPALELIC